MSSKSKYRFRRKRDIRKPYKTVYIFTEGEKTEPNYFRSKKEEIETEIRRKNIKIEINGTAHNTLSLISFTLAFIEKEKIDLGMDDCWVVFDKDDFDKDFDNAIDKAFSNGLKVAYSNESFELWFLLHFNFYDSAIRREGYISKLTDNLKKLTENKKFKYEKNSENMYLILKDMEKDAIRNAEKLLTMHKGEKSFLKKNPSTTVHLLVESLNKLKEK